VTNLKLIVNANGWSAYDAVNLDSLISNIKAFGFNVIEIYGHDMKAVVEALRMSDKNDQTVIFARTSSDQIPCLKGLDAHYCVMNNNDYAQALELLK